MAAGAAATAVDTSGEVIGEAASQQVARGEIDKGDALREGVASMGQSVAEVGAGVLMAGIGAGAQWGWPIGLWVAGMLVIALSLAALATVARGR